MRQEMTGFRDGSGISWTICKQSLQTDNHTNAALSSLVTNRCWWNYVTLTLYKNYMRWPSFTIPSPVIELSSTRPPKVAILHTKATKNWLTANLQYRNPRQSVRHIQTLMHLSVQRLMRQTRSCQYNTCFHNYNLQHRQQLSQESS